MFPRVPSSFPSVTTLTQVQGIARGFRERAGDFDMLSYTAALMSALDRAPARLCSSSSSSEDIQAQAGFKLYKLISPSLREDKCLEHG